MMVSGRRTRSARAARLVPLARSAVPSTLCHPTYVYCFLPARNSLNICSSVNMIATRTLALCSRTPPLCASPLHGTSRRVTISPLPTLILQRNLTNPSSTLAVVVAWSLPVAGVSHARASAATQRLPRKRRNTRKPSRMRARLHQLSSGRKRRISKHLKLPSTHRHRHLPITYSHAPIALLCSSYIV